MEGDSNVVVTIAVDCSNSDLTFAVGNSDLYKIQEIALREGELFVYGTQCTWFCCTTTVGDDSLRISLLFGRSLHGYEG
jgi:hypothetical protein